MLDKGPCVGYNGGLQWSATMVGYSRTHRGLVRLWPGRGEAPPVFWGEVVRGATVMCRGGQGDIMHAIMHACHS